MSLIGNVYVQPSSSDPGAVGVGYEWLATDTGNLFYRNTSNTAWVLAGNVNQTYLGLLNRGGGTMTGAILGAHGLMPLAGGDFSVAPTITGNTVATVPYVNAQIQNLQSQINTQITQAVASIPGLSVSSKIASVSGVSGSLANGGTFTIPLPTYGDGTTASATDVAGRYGAWPMVFLGADTSTGVATTTLTVVETGVGTRTFSITSLNTGAAPPASGYFIGYTITAIKA